MMLVLSSPNFGGMGTPTGHCHKLAHPSLDVIPSFIFIFFSVCFLTFSKYCVRSQVFEPHVRTDRNHWLYILRFRKSDKLLIVTLLLLPETLHLIPIPIPVPFHICFSWSGFAVIFGPPFGIPFLTSAVLPIIIWCSSRWLINIIYIFFHLHAFFRTLFMKFLDNSLNISSESLSMTLSSANLRLLRSRILGC